MILPILRRTRSAIDRQISGVILAHAACVARSITAFVEAPAFYKKSARGAMANVSSYNVLIACELDTMI